MDKAGSVTEKKNNQGLIIGFFFMLSITFIMFLIIRWITNAQIFKTFKSNIMSDIEVTSAQFDNIIDSDIMILSETARIIAANEEMKGSRTSDLLKSVEEGSCFSQLYLVYSDGKVIDSSMQENDLDIDSISGIFSSTGGVEKNRVVSENSLLIHVPVIEGNVELVALYDNSLFVGRSGMADADIYSEYVLFDSTTGETVIDVNNGRINENNVNYFDEMENTRYYKGYNYADMRRDILNRQTGIAAYYDNGGELLYACYSPLNNGNLYVMQIISEDVIMQSSSGLRNNITAVLMVLVLIYLLLLLFTIYINRKRDKENQEIKMQVRVAELANEAKTIFLSNMSHDIRTPLNAIVGLADICEMNADNPDRVRECISKQKAASEHLMTLINDVLEMSKIESGKVAFINSEFNIGISIHNIVMLVQQRMLDKKLRFNVAVNNLVHEDVIGDEQRINRAVLNIISNAIKFTDVGGKVSVVIDEAPSQKEGYADYSITVKDTGIGMTEEFVKRIFIPFERMHDSTVSQIDGAGLGMTIAHDLIESIGGDIQVSSRLGSGTTITINIPLKIAGEGVIPEQYKPVVEHYNGQFVIVVDNDVIMVEWMDRLLSSLGLKCISTTSGADAIDVVKKMHEASQPIALMIFGWKMPKMSGPELAVQMRAVVGNDIPIILQTAYEFNENDDELRTAGINKILVEPIFRSDLMEVFYEMVNGGNDSKMAFPDFGGRRVLLVDDHKVNAEIIAEYLNYTGIEVDIAYDGSEAVDKIQMTPDGYYDLIFMDIRMPKLNGYEATRQIRAMRSDYTLNIPIIALSANAFIEDKKNSKAAGMNGHLAKPVKYEEIYAELKKWF
ncbi:MAG: response regulator [Lachnospiraceae bacterium]|nr:response regulator [Lachnospiraceae bacterium]